MKKLLLILLLLPFVTVAQTGSGKRVGANYIISGDNITVTSDGALSIDTINIGGCVRKNGVPITFCAAPYGCWLDLTDQTIGTNAVDSAIKFNTTQNEMFITLAANDTDFVLLGNSADRVVTVTLIEQFDAGDNMSLRWYGETTNVFLNTNAATGNIPRVPCIILTINLIWL